MFFGLVSVTIKASMFVGVMSLALLPTRTYGQAQTVQYEEVFKAEILAGRVLDQAGSTIGGVRVQVCGKHWINCSTSTNTNQDGSFSFPAVTEKRLYHLRLTSPGFNPLEVSVKTGYAGKELILKMQIAT